MAPVPLVPSPNVQAYAAIVPSGSDEPVPLRPTVRPSTPGVPITAVGRWLTGGDTPRRDTVNRSKASADAAVALLERNPEPSPSDVDAITNLCRCGTYVRIRRAIARAAREIQDKA